MYIKLLVFLFVLKFNESLSKQSYVIPISPKLISNTSLPNDENSKLSATVHLNTNKYGLTSWWTKHFAKQSQRYLDFNGNQQLSILPGADESMALALSLRTGLYNESHTGVKREVAMNISLKLITSLAKWHLINTEKGWGNGWQTALWAYYVGLGGWLLWDHIHDPIDRDYIENMIVYESDRLINFKVPYYQDINGKVIYKGDTKAEENGWDSQILQLSTVMLPKHPNHQKWSNKMIELIISSYSSPSDLHSTRVLHGKQVKDWLKGSNIYANGTCVNHGRFHPDYMQCIAYLLGAPNTFALAGVPTPEAAFFNDELVYESLVRLKWTHPPYAAPGGTIYVETTTGNTTQDIYYPQGDDWGTVNRMHFAALDSMMTFFTKNGHKYRSEEWQKQHITRVLQMQSRFTDGHSYASSHEFTAAWAEEWVASWSTFNYMTRWVAHNFKIMTTNQIY